MTKYIHWGETTLVAALLCVSTTAFAQAGSNTEEAAASDCPPGAVCEKASSEAPASADAKESSESESNESAKAENAPQGQTVVIPPPPPGSDPGAPRVLVVRPSADGGPSQVIVYEDGAAPPHLLDELEEPMHHAPPPPPPPARKKRWKRHRQWGMNLRLQGVWFPRYRSDLERGTMGGMGISLRFRPIPSIAIDAGAEFLGGTDANGYDREEIPFSLSAMFYPNPHDMAQFYVLGGLNWSVARVFSTRPQAHLADGTTDEYQYMGGHIGAGIEFRVSRLIGINLDGLGFVRARTDNDSGGDFPEYYDATTGEASNSSAGGMARVGMTFWW